MHLISGFNQLTGIMRTAYNQYESLVLPLQAWLDSAAYKRSWICALRI